jgi:hypothetical protein
MSGSRLGGLESTIAMPMRSVSAMGLMFQMTSAGMCALQLLLLPISGSSVPRSGLAFS